MQSCMLVKMGDPEMFVKEAQTHAQQIFRQLLLVLNLFY